LPGEPLWAFAYTDGHGYCDGSSVGYAHSNGYCHGNRYCIANAEDYAYTAAAPNGAPPAVSLGLHTAFFGNSRSNSRVPEKP
jgi:hypothetical protein